MLQRCLLHTLETVKHHKKEMLNTAKKLTDLIKWIQIKLLREIKRILDSNVSVICQKLMRKEQLMLEDGSISQDQFDTQLRDKIGKQLKQLTKKICKF